MVWLVLAGCGSHEVVEKWEGREIPSAIVASFQRELDDNEAEGVAFAILQDGVITFAGALGDRQPGVAMEPDTLLRHASLLKMQTAAAVVDAESEGLLSLDDAIEDLLPDFRMPSSPGAEGATLHELLSHQGGFFDDVPVDGPTRDSALYDYAHDTFAERYWTLAPAGSFWNYSNVNYSLAGLMLEEATGDDYASRMAEQIWDPLGMGRTFFDGDDVAADGNYATSVARDWDGPGDRDVGPTTYDHAFSRPAAMGWTNTLDLLRFAHFLMVGHPDVADDTGLESLTTAQVDTRVWVDGGLQYGYGVYVADGFRVGDDWYADALWYHDGNMPGYGADLWMLPEHGVAIAVLNNGHHEHFRTAIRESLASLVELTPRAAPDESFTASDLQALDGTYIDPWAGGPLIVRAVGDGLSIEAPELRAGGVPFEPVLDVQFATQASWKLGTGTTWIDFIPDDEGVMRWLRTRRFVGERR